MFSLTHKNGTFQTAHLCGAGVVGNTWCSALASRCSINEWLSIGSLAICH